MQNALIFKLANLKGAVSTQIIPQLATAGDCKLNKGIRNKSRIDELKRNSKYKFGTRDREHLQHSIPCQKDVFLNRVEKECLRFGEL